MRGFGLGLAGLGTVALTGCGLRWETDAPELPVLPRDRHDGAEVLRAEFTRIVEARATAAAAGDAVVVAANTEQLQALAHRLEAVRDVRPESPLVVPPAPKVATPPAAQLASLRETASRAQWRGLVAATTGEAAYVLTDTSDMLLLASEQVSRLALGRRLGGRWPALTPDDGIEQLPAPVSDQLLPIADRTAYVLDVCAARATPAQKAAATGSREAAHRILTDLRATASTDNLPELGYPLDPPTTPAAVAAAAAEALASLSDALVAAIPDRWRVAQVATGPVLALRRRAAECEQWHTAWTNRVRSLPGLAHAPTASATGPDH